MREQPPKTLVELLDRLGLANGRQVAGVYRRARRLARDLPLFESVWVDALAQAQILSPFQAAEINAGRGEALGVGPYVLCQPLGWPGYAAFYRARRRDSPENVRLAVIDPLGGEAAQIKTGLEKLAAASAGIESESLAPVLHVGTDGDRGWAMSRHVEGRTAAQWMVHNGRFPPEIVIEIARQVLAGLVALERAGLCHGDIGAAALVLTDDGRAVLPQPGLRAVVRPVEGCAHADLLPEAYDYLAPERVADGTPPTVGSELYACGCLWWHLLAGRPPIPGATSLAKLRGVQTAKVPDVQRLAPDTPSELAAVVAACLRHDPARRPASIVDVAARLGPSTHSGRLALARCVTRPGRRTSHWAVSMRSIKQSNQAPLWLAAAAGALVAAVALGWSIWNAQIAVPPASIGSSQPPAAAGMASDERLASEPPANAGPDAAPPPAALGDPNWSPQAATGPQDPVAETEASPGIGPSAPTTEAAEKPADLVLPAGKPLAVEALECHPGQCVRGAPGERPVLAVPPTGLHIRTEGVRFENVDFLWGADTTAKPPGTRPISLVDLRAGRVEFRGCTFRAAGTGADRPPVVRWTHPGERTAAELALPSGRVEFANCLFTGVGAAVQCHTLGAREVTMVNTLHLGRGPLVRLDRCLKPDEPLAIALAHVTLRGEGAVLEVHYRQPEQRPGPISIQALQCVFAPQGSSGLLVFDGRQSPASLLSSVRWTGQGSLVSPEAAMAVWRDGDGRGEVLDDTAAAIDGLVRGKVEFAGPADGGPMASRIVRWQGPLLSSDSPGANPDAFDKPHP
jgi:hypothetical protein